MTQISNVSRVSHTLQGLALWPRTGRCSKWCFTDEPQGSRALLVSTHLSALPNSMVQFHAGKSIQVLHTNGRSKILKSAPARLVKRLHDLCLGFRDLNSLQLMKSVTSIGLTSFSLPWILTTFDTLLGTVMCTTEHLNSIHHGLHCNYGKIIVHVALIIKIAIIPMNVT